MTKRKDIMKELKNRIPTDLEKLLQEKRGRLWELKRDLAAGKVKNVREINEVKRTIARIFTFLHKFSHQI